MIVNEFVFLKRLRIIGYMMEDCWNNWHKNQLFIWE